MFFSRWTLRIALRIGLASKERSEIVPSISDLPLRCAQHKNDIWSVRTARP